MTTTHRGTAISSVSPPIRRRHPPSRLGLAATATMAVVVAALAAGCATPPPPPPQPVPDTIVRVDTVVVESDPVVVEDAESAQRVARLQMQILERDAQIRELDRRLDQATQEVVRAMARLRSLATRAEAASGLAEAQLAVDALQSATGESPPAVLAQSRALLEMSRSEFDAENYGGALYLSTEAKALARASQTLVGSDAAPSVRGEQPFALPVRLETTTRSNVRGGPGMDHAVLFTLDPAVTLVAHSYTDQWVRISDPTDRRGWIFHTLVRSPAEGTR